ncbi:hypothetical protein SADUNF_Sadunf18G0046100 [Salix dunnii]|uniref:Uncharacterized protein n=1 Tax=Salix dunnii TaxID=1413687 RepID=A0A835J5Z7_9ROSI|nr:hypothetical protein SADUNF_Sadunf18G0046100 [Salix dunnii]
MKVQKRRSVRRSIEVPVMEMCLDGIFVMYQFPIKLVVALPVGMSGGGSIMIILPPRSADIWFRWDI